MHIQIESESLGEAYSRCAGVVNPSSPKEVLQNILLRVDDKLTLIGSNGETTALAEAEAQIERPGKALIPGKRLGLFVKEFSGLLSFEVVGDEIIFNAPGATFRIPTANPDEYPAVTLIDGGATEVDSAALERAIRKTSFACEQDSARYALGGIRIEDWQVVGTDGRRLAYCPIPNVSGEIRVLVPEKAALLIANMLHEEKAYVSHDVTNVQVRCGRYVLNTRQVEGRYPNWRQVLISKEGKYRASLTAGSLHAAIRQAAITADGETRGIDFTFGDGSINLKSHTADKGHAAVSVPAEYSGDEVKIKLDYKYVEAFLKTCESDEIVSVYLSATTAPAMIVDAGGAEYVVMPMAMER